MSMRGAWTLAMLLVLPLASVGCGSGEAGGPGPNGGSLVGEVNATGASIAIVSDGEEFAGYVCDHDGVATWLRGDRIGAAIRLLSRDGEPLGKVEFPGRTARGEITVEGARHAFTARRATGEAGLYRAFVHGRRETVEAGWVVLDDGGQCGTIHVAAQGRGPGETEPAPVMEPEGSFDVSVDVDGTALRLAVQKVTPLSIGPVTARR